MQIFSPKKSETLLIIPVINEGERIRNQLQRINGLNLGIDVLIADGGSNDGSLDREFLLNQNVLALLINKDKAGVSNQLKTAFNYAVKMQYKYVITMDGNNKDHPNGIVNIQNSLENGFEFVQGSRFIREGQAINTPISRYWAIRLIHAPLTSLFACRWYTDTTNGFRGFHISIFKDPLINPFREKLQNYDLLFYLPIRISRLRYKVSEVPVIREYPKKLPTPTKIKGFKSMLKLLISLIRTGVGYNNPKSDPI